MADSGDDDSFLRELAQAPERAPEEAPPERLAQFRIVERIGKGGMGVVYRAVDEKLGREVALKVLPSAFERDEERRRRFLREARAAAAVTHPNLITVFEIDEADGRIFIAMELVAGKSLRDHLTRSKLPLDEALRIFREIARGVAKAHERGIVHRDLKPDNVMLTGDGGVKVLDFGLAKQRAADLEHADTQTNEGKIVGTPEYMSPEQAAGRAVDARSDVFSLGVILYELCAGERPFRGASAMDVLVSVARDQPPPPKVSGELQALIARSLEKDPARRFADAAAFLAALASPPRPVRRSLVPIALAAGLVLAGAAFAIYRLGGPTAPATPRVVTVTDHPAPPSSVPEARTEYTAGLQSLRDNNWASASTHFDHAAALDPSLAILHLRSAMSGAAHVGRRESFRRAVAMRMQLEPRDRELMDALEPTLGRDQADSAETLARLTAFAERHPGDVEALDWIGMVADGSLQGLQAGRKATELDPSDGQAWEIVGRTEQRVGRLEEARAAFRRCSQISELSSDCLAWLARLEEVEGRCAEFERAILAGADCEPSLLPLDVMRAMVAMHRPEAAVQARLSRYVTAAPENTRELQRLRATIDLLTHAGRFDEALRMCGDAERALDASTDAAEAPVRLGLARQWINLLLEIGRADEARRRAADVVATLSQWSGLDRMVAAAQPLWLAHLAGVRAEELAAQRETWIAKRRQIEEPPGLIWLRAWAATAWTPEEALRALEAIDRDRRLAAPRPDESVQSGDSQADAGRVYLLAGRPAEAIPFLRAAVANCSMLVTPREHALAGVDLGRALEATGDRPGACAAYAGVIALWGNAKPRSVTAEAARTRLSALGCK